MNRRLLLILICALIGGAGASYLVYRMVGRSGPAGPPTTQVVMAARDLEIGTLIAAPDVRMGPWAGTLPKGALTRVDLALNRGAVANIYQGEPILAERLAAAGSGGGLAAIIPPGLRATAVRVDEVVGLAGFVTPGMRVDVLMSGIPPGGSPNEGSRVNTLLQNIQVLSAGENLQKDSEGKAQKVQVVNLLVTPEQAEKLTLASSQTHIQLVLRNPLDTETASPPGARMSELFGTSAPRPLRATEPALGGKPRPARTEIVLRPPAPGVPPFPQATRVQTPRGGDLQRHGQDGSSFHNLGRPGHKRGFKVRMKLRWSPRVSGNSSRPWAGRATPFALPVAWMLALLFMTAGAQEHRGTEASATAFAARSFPQTAQAVELTVGKSILLASMLPMERVAIGLGGFAEVTAVGPSEVLVNGKAPGETTLIIWQEDGTKLYYDLAVRPSRFLANNRIELVDRQIQEELPGQSIRLTLEDDTFFLRGTVKDVTSAERAYSIASTLGKAVNLLYVDIPAPEAQILLRVKFASVDRSLSTQMGVNLFSTGAVNTIGSLSTGQFNPPTIGHVDTGAKSATAASLSDALNLFLFRPDLNLGATIKLLESRGLLEVLAEPNVLAQNGKEASFLAGGEFPFPVVQGSSGGASAAVTIQFREFGVRLKFIPTITPRGSISLQVAPEVSALDFTHGLTVSGFSVPAVTVRKLSTAVELNEGQSFAIGGLLDNRVTESLEKVPFLGDLPVLGKFFQSRSHSKENTELLVIVTPELVRPIPRGAPLPQLRYSLPFLEPNTAGGVAGSPQQNAGAELPRSVPIETLLRNLQAESSGGAEQPRPPSAPMLSSPASPKK